MTLRKIRFFLTVSIFLTGLLTACSALITRSEGTGPAPIVETVLAPTADQGLRPLSVTAIAVDVGQGSPIPVEVVASGDWPDPCAQLAEVSQRLAGDRFEIALLASTADPECPPDAAGVPFRIAVPLNMVDFMAGEYFVEVNGVSARFDWDPAGASPPAAESPDFALRIAYLGPDGNVWTLDLPEGTTRQLTTDADSGPMDGTMPTTAIITYYFPAISSDGQMVAYRRDFSTPAEGSLDFTSGLWVYDLQANEVHQVYDNIPAGLAWKPGTHLLAYGQGVDENYFQPRGLTPDPELATGIRGIDLDTSQVLDLVAPEGGFALYTPAWSPDGRFLSFNELIGYEGSGNFGYYDFEAQEYVGWDVAIGLYDWSPDGNTLAYDWLTYTATGTERIFIRPRTGGEERQVSPDFEKNGYAFSPVFSPDSDRIAYLAGLEGPDVQKFTIFIQDLEGGDPQEFGTFESAFGLSWTADGSHLILGAGPWESRQLYAVDAESGAIMALAPGSQPALSDHLQ